MIPLDSLLTQLKQRDIRLWVEGGALKYSAPRNALTPELLAALAHHKPALLDVLRRAQRSDPANGPDIDQMERPDPLPLSFAQERMWFLHQMEGNQPAYNVFKAARLQGAELDEQVLEDALSELVRRHESLRTCFPAHAGVPYQRILPPEPVDLPLLDLQTLKAGEQEARLQAAAQEFGMRVFNLAEAPLFRFMLVRMAPQEHVLLICMHHIISDGWSLDILFRELGELYLAFSEDRAPALDPSPLQYADFTLWQREHLHASRLEPQLDAWQKELEGIPAALTLNYDKPRPAEANFKGSTFFFQLSPELTSGIRALRETTGKTPFMVLLAAYAVLLHRYSGMDDIVIGAPVANRTYTRLEDILGFFVNTLALRLDLSGNPSFLELLQRVRETSVAALARQDLPFEVLVESLQPKRDLSRNPLFQVMLAFQSRPSIPPVLGPFDAQGVNVPLETSILDINFMVWEGQETFTCLWNYDTDLFERETIQQMVNHLQAVLTAVLDNAAVRIDAIPLLDDQERRLLLETWSPPQAHCDEAACIHDLVAAQAGRTPDAVAVTCGDARLSCRELDLRANQLAHALQKRGVGADIAVGICLPRSLNSMIAVLGVLKAGGAYVPLDPAYPDERLAFMLEDSGAGVVLADASTADRFPADVLMLMDDAAVRAPDSVSAPVAAVDKDDLAYVMYTSGSTGRPKAVAMPHRALVNLIRWQLDQTVDPRAKTLQFTTLSFDVSFQEIFATWCGGGTLVLLQQDQVHDMQAVAGVLAAEGVERLFLPFAALQNLAEAADDAVCNALRLREVITAGEQLRITAEMERFFSRLEGCELVNQYGPTETHVVSSYRLNGEPHGWPALPPIGRPIDNVQLYLLDEHMQPVPIGVTGELYIGGCALARGYHNRSTEERARFLPHPFDAAPGARLYRTGDLARWLRSGEIAFQGRSDDQVKIRGYRVEPGEIEAALTALPEVRACAVAVRGEGAGQRLVAYVVPTSAGGLDTEIVKRRLRRTLPEYMLPGVYVPLEALPLTPNGKIDRRALPEPDIQRPGADEERIRPRDALERRIAAIWEQVLGLQPIGVREDFFDLGGHSLMAVRLIAGLEEATGVRLPVAALFQAPTIEGQAELVREEGWVERESTLVPIRTGGAAPPLFLVHWAGGNVLVYRELAGRLPADRAIYGLQALGVDGKVRPHTTVEEMAAYYLKEIRAVQPHGPYYLGGASLGGSIAFEMARQLQQMGEDVGLVALFDTIGRPNQFALPVSERVGLHLGHLRERSLRGKLRYLAERTRIRLQRALYRMWIGSGLPLPHSMWNVKQTTYYAFKAYRPGPYDGDILLFRAEERGAASSASQFLGWEAVEGVHIRTIPIPGKHATVLAPPGVALVAEALAGILAGEEDGLAEGKRA